MTDRVVVVRPEPERVVVRGGLPGPKGEPGSAADLTTYVSHDGTPAVGDWLKVKSTGPLVVERAAAPSGGAEPWLVQIQPGLVPPASTIGTWTIATNTDRWNYFDFRNSSEAQNDEATWNVVLSAGTWTFDLLFIQFSKCGIFSVQLDGVEVGTIDGYATPSALVNTRAAITGIVVATTGKKVLKLKLATKNASSTGYASFLQAIQLRRTA